MSEQTIQNNLYTNNVSIMDKYECLSLGATTVKNLMELKIIKKFNINDKLLSKKPDVLVVDKEKNVVIYQEHKLSNKLNSDKDIEEAIIQEIEVAKALKAKIYIVSDGENFIWINPMTGNPILDENRSKINFQVKPKENSRFLVELINKVILSINKANDQILKKQYLDPTNLAVKINKILKNLTFATAKQSLYTFVELFLFKYLSDIGILTEENSFEYICSLYNKSGNSDAKVLGKYTDGARKTMKTLFPEGNDGTSIINGQVFHVEKDEFNNYISKDNTDMIFKQVIEEFKNYEEENGKFLNISKDFKSKLFETFMKNSDEKSGMGQFFTPLKVVDEMINMVDINDGMEICDPACGVGKFLLEAIEDKIDEDFYIEDEKLVKKINIYGFEKMMNEKDDITVILAKANMLIYFSDLFKKNNSLNSVKYLSNELLNKTFKLNKTMLGTLDKIDENKYDLIMANPPYYKSKAMKDLAYNTGLYNLNGAGVESLFLEWIMKSLKYGGIGNIVLPDGIFSNIANKKLKQYLLDHFFIESIISLPVNTFFNTPKKTYILTIRKKTKQELLNNIKQEYPVFTYICNSIGETLDAYRFDTPDENDLHEAVCKYNNFKNLQDKINIKNPFKEYFDNDNKFKAINIDEFSADKSWIIEDWWNEEEKIKIGLKKEQKVINIDEFEDMIDNTMDEMNNIKEELEEEKKAIESFTIEKMNNIVLKPINITKLFDLHQGNCIYTKKAIRQNNWGGDIPVISSNTENNGILDYIDKEYIKEKDLITIPCISWSVDGNAGKMFVRNEKFVPNNHCGVMLPKSEKIDFDYIILTMQKDFFDKAKNSSNKKLGNNQIEKLEVSMPIDENGEYNLEIQKKLAEKYREINKIRSKILDLIDRFSDINIQI